MAKGFKRRYFSLAAIAATVSCIQLQAVANSVVAHEQQLIQGSEKESDEETAEIEEIVVESALPSSSTLKNLTSDITIITSEELNEKHYTTVLDALKAQASLFVTQNGGPGQSSGLTLRGMSSEHLLVLVDGVRLNDPTSTKGQALLEHLLVQDIRQIEIIKGSQSGVWGADASGGVINIVTKKAAKGLQINGHLMGGSYTTHASALNMSYATDRWMVSAGAQGYRTDGFPPKTTSTFDAGYIDRNYYLKAAGALSDKTKIDASIRQILADGAYEGSNPTTFLPEKQQASAKTTLYHLGIDHRVASWQLKAYGNGSDFKRIYNGHDYEGDTKMAGVGAIVSIPNGSYSFGYDYRKDSMRRNYGAPLNSLIKNSALYGAFRLATWQQHMVVNASLRYDHYDAYKDKTTGKIGIKYLLPWYDASMAANVGTGYRAPSLYERFGGDGFTAPNDRLKPESTTSYDVTFSIDGWKTTYFYNQITDLIDYQFGIYPSPGNYTNIDGKTTIQGVELSYIKALERLDSSLKLSYQYLDAKDAQNNRLFRRPRHKAVADWITFFTDALSFDLNMIYAADYLDNDYSTYPAQTVQMGSYTLFNAVLNYDVAKKGGFYLKWHNIFNEDYQTVYGYNSEQSSLYLGWRLTY